MFEGCSSLSELEDKISTETKKVSLLGEIPLSEQDVECMLRLTRSRIKGVDSTIVELGRSVPCVLACLLVQLGVRGYSEGDYWTAVEDAFEISLSANQQVRIGRQFLKFLDEHDLYSCEILNAPRYVTSILLHGGIPNTCLTEYFEKICWPLVERDLGDPREYEEVRAWLGQLRTRERQRMQAAQRSEELGKDARELRACARYLEQILPYYDELLQLIEAKAKKSQIEIPSTLPDDIPRFLESKRRALETLRREIQHLGENMVSQMKAFDVFTQEERLILARLDEVEAACVALNTIEKQCQVVRKMERRVTKLETRLETGFTQVSGSEWDERIEESLCHIDLSVLSDEISTFSHHSAHVATLEEELPQRERALRVSTKDLLTLLMTCFSFLFGMIALIRKSWWQTAFCFLIFVLSGSSVRRWRWQRKRKGCQLQSLRDRLAEAQRAQEEARRKIQDMLSSLFIKKDILREPDQTLFQRLRGLQDICEQQRSTQEDLCRLCEKSVKERKKINALLQELGLEGGSDPQTALQESLARARVHQKEVQLATDELLGLLKRLLGLVETGLGLTSELDQVYNQMAPIGDGDVRSGLKRIRAARADADKLKSLQCKLRSNLSDLSGVERELRRRMRRGETRDDLESDIAALCRDLESIEGHINNAREEMRRWPAVYPQVDEPIRRYLLYGGDSAERFLASSVNLLYQALTDASQETVREQIPRRVTNAFDIWWKEWVSELGEEGSERNREERLERPKLEVDPTYGQIHIICPKQILRRDNISNSVEFAIMGVDEAQSLRLYARDSALVETEECEIALPFSPEDLAICLRSEGRVLRQWSICLWHPNAPCMVFDANSLRLIEEEELPRTTLWLLLSPHVKVDEPDVLAEEPLYEAWYNYRLVQVDIGEGDDLTLVNEEGSSFRIPLQTKAPKNVKVVGADRIWGVDSNGVDVYKELPRLRIPIDSEKDLTEWLVTIIPEEDQKRAVRYIPLDDLQSAVVANPQGTWVDVNLNDETLLGTEIFGSVILRLQRESYHRVALDARICVIPDLNFCFSRMVYPPFIQEEPRRVTVDLTGLEFKFIAEPPAQTRRMGSDYRIVTSSDVDFLNGAVQRMGDGASSVPLSIEIPKIHWRLRGLDKGRWENWQDTIDEVWLGDWENCEYLHLDIRLPGVLAGSVGLTVGDDATEDQRLQAGKARFDLLSRQQILRNWPALKPFRLRFVPEMGEEEEVLLFRGRTHWQVHDVQITQKYEANKVVLDVSWQESGRVGNRNRIVRLWRCDAAQQEPTVRKGVQKQRVLFRLDNVDFDTSYRLQFTLQDPWEGDVVTLPDQDEPNVVEFVLHPESGIGELIILEQALDRRGWSHPLPDNAYYVKILGRIADLRVPENVQTKSVTVTTGNEGWFVGEFYAINADLRSELNREFKRINPVKVQPLGASYRGAIEDREGEGTMYCMKCKRLYWNEEDHLRCREQGYSLIGPIDRFKIRRLRSAQEEM